MKRILYNIHWLIWGCIPIFLIYSFVSKNYVDVNIHDTMFVIAAKYVSIFISIIFFITGLGYYLSYKSDKFKPVAVLTIVHVVFLFGGLILLFFIPEYRYELPAKTPLNMNENPIHYMLYNDMKVWSGFAVFIAQPILLLNLIISIFRK